MDRTHGAIEHLLDLAMQEGQVEVETSREDAEKIRARFYSLRRGLRAAYGQIPYDDLVVRIQDGKLIISLRPETKAWRTVQDAREKTSGGPTSPVPSSDSPVPVG